MAQEQYKNFAFISYNHGDKSLAEWLQRRLESFRLPAEAHSDMTSSGHYIRPVFRDRSDLNTGILSDELRVNLERSKYLIVICSVRSARSEWVSREAAAFVEMGRLNRIIPVIVPSEGVAETDLFPESLRRYFAGHPDSELLGVNLGEDGRRKALVRIVSRMLDVSFDSLWHRYRRRRRVRLIAGAVAGVVMAAAAYLFALPVNVTLNVVRQSSALPEGGLVEALIAGARYESDEAEPRFGPVRIPGYRRLMSLPISVNAEFYVPTDTSVIVGLGLRRDINIVLRRDSTFACFAGTVTDPQLQPLEGVEVTVGDTVATTDSDGHFMITFPLEMQRTEMAVKLDKDGYESEFIIDETPGRDLKYILYP